MQERVNFYDSFTTQLRLDYDSITTQLRVPKLKITNFFPSLRAGRRSLPSGCKTQFCRPKSESIRVTTHKTQFCGDYEDSSRDMKIFLTKQCESFTGSLGQGFGYHIQRRGESFYGVRQSKGHVPSLGHLRFIITCAQMAKMALHIADINIKTYELWQALTEAGLSSFAATLKLKYGPMFPSRTINAKQVLDFAEEYKLMEMLK